jgi:hypothetical protein
LPSYGLIVEGDADRQVFEHLVRKVNSPDAPIYPLVCGGVNRLMREFPALLQTFEYAHNGGPVDGALVIRDCDNKPGNIVLTQMREKLGARIYNFPRGVELCAVNKKLDSWLLADEGAINQVSRARRGKAITRVNETIEDITHPKERLQKKLSEAKLIYTSAVLGEIAAAINLEQLEYRVPSFASFKESVLKIYR